MSLFFEVQMLVDENVAANYFYDIGSFSTQLEAQSFYEDIQKEYPHKILRIIQILVTSPRE